MKLEKAYIRIKQGQFTMYLISLTAKELIEFTTVDYFDPSKDTEDQGYQRQLITNHYRKIAKFLETESSPFLPPAILTAIDPADINEGMKLITLKNQIRVVDGQHRIEGLRYLKKINEESYNEISNYEFPVVLIVIQEGQKIHEINTFVNINSKGKKVNTDLAIMLRDRIREEEFNQKVLSLGTRDFEEAISTKIAKKLNDSKDSVWYDSIKMAAGEQDKGKPISINIFNQSLKDLIRIYVKSSSAERTIKEIDIIVDELATFISSSWDYVVKKWPRCFNIYGDRKYSKLYNIQKGIGVYPIHQILTECIDNDDSSLDNALLNFKRILMESEVEYMEWKVGSMFSAYNSRAGFKKIAEYIKINSYDEDLF